MRVIKPSTTILYPQFPDEIYDIYRRIELAGRTCYKSEERITSDSSKKFIRALIKSGHEAMIEHGFMTVKFTVDRGISHEIVRHRLASYAQESSRYCNYSNAKFNHEITVIKPFWMDEDSETYSIWYDAMKEAEKAYFELLDRGCTAQEARSVLPNSLKTELVMTASMREWRNVFKLRAAGTTGAPHPQMSEVMVPLLERCQKIMPELFDDIIIERN